MKKLLFLCILFISCEKKHIWKYEVAPGTSYADSFYAKPDFKPRGYKLQLNGELQSDAIVVISSYHNLLDSKKRVLGQNFSRQLKRGIVNFVQTAEMYDDDLKVIIISTDTTTKKSPMKKDADRPSSLGNLSVKISFF